MASNAPAIARPRPWGTGAWPWVLLLLTVAMPPAATSEDDAALRLPGTFSERTTVADLQAMFGVAQVQLVPEGEGRRSVVLFPHDPARRAYVEFHDAMALQGVRSISVRDPDSRWRGKQGVHVGMSFAELRARNGKPFYFSGFDDSGFAMALDGWSPASDLDDSVLGKLDVGEGEHMYFGVALGLRKDVGDVDAAATPRDASVSSDDPRYPRLGELVEVTAIQAITSLDDEWD